ncbi:klaroid protein-like isoform X2 [Sycon ciliatum]|uniref:klaroid protein-like isoform X2 n=1 Tax=Sycon ciliatum TaxID=27933 RepID=UPI0031F6586C
MASRTPRRRNVQVDVSVPRRSPRTAPMSISGLHPATPVDSTLMTRTEFQILTRSGGVGGIGTDELSSAYRHALDDSENDDTHSSVVSASPVAGHRRTPQKKRITAKATVTSSTRRSTRRKAAALDLSDEEVDVGSASDAGLSSHGSSSNPWPYQGSDEETRDQSHLAPPPSAARHPSELPPPLSPILEESPRTNAGASRANLSATRIDWDVGAKPRSLGHRLSSALSHLWWLAGSRLYLLSSAILCWDVWLIVSAQHMARCIMPSFFMGSASSSFSSSSSATAASPSSQPRRGGSSAKQMSASLSFAILVLAALFIFILGIAFLSRVEKSATPTTQAPAVSEDLVQDSIANLSTSNVSEAELRRIITSVMNAQLREHSQQVDQRIQSSHKELLSDVEEAVMKVLTQPTTRAHQHWDKRLSSTIDSKSTEVKAQLKDHVTTQQSAAVDRHDNHLKQELEKLQASIKQQLADKDTRQAQLSDRLATLSTSQTSLDAQIASVEKRLLDKISQETAAAAAAAAAAATPTASTTEYSSGVSEEVVQQKVDAIEATLRDRLDAVEKLLKVVESEQKESSSQISDKVSEQSLTDLTSQITNLQTSQQQNAEQVTSDTAQLRASLLSKDDVAAIAAAVVKRLATDEAEFGDVHEWLDKRYATASASLCSSIPDCKQQLLDLLSSDFRDLVKQEVATLPVTAAAQEKPGQAVREASKDGLTRDDVSEMITTSIDEYAADRIGRYDYAMEAQGGQVFIEGTSPSFDPGVRMKLLGFSLFSLSYPPRLAISPEILPGNCWPLSGTSGHITLILSADIRVTHVSVDHIPASLTTDGKRTSAPRAFSVVALSEQTSVDGDSLGDFEYKLDGPSVQTFPVQSSPNVVRYVRFNVTSNHGHSDYTCLYRLRVHGDLSEPQVAV